MDLEKRRDFLEEKIHKKYDEANSLWRSTIRLLITLSTSFLVLTISFVKALFPDLALVGYMGIWLIFSWICFIGTIIFGLITEIDETIFQGNAARKWQKELIEIEKKLAQGVTANDHQKTPASENNIFYGFFTMQFFLLAVFSLCAALLQRVFVEGRLELTFVFFLMIIGSCWSLWGKYKQRFKKDSKKSND